MWKRVSALFLAAAPLLAGCASAPRAPEPLTEPFRVLLLGDSISIGYTPVVQSVLEGRAVVLRPMNPGKNGVAGAGSAENCAGTNKGVANLDRWLAIDGGEWDVIHFNFGLHDLKRVQPDSAKNSNDPTHPHQAAPEQYEAQLHTIVTRLKETGARLIFATTTPVPEGDLRPYRETADAVAYNLVAVRVMKDEGVAIDDLFQFVTDYPETILRPANVHFTKEGSRALGEQVAASILAAAGLPAGR